MPGTTTGYGKVPGGVFVLYIRTTNGTWKWSKTFQGYIYVNRAMLSVQRSFDRRLYFQQPPFLIRQINITHITYIP